MQVMLSWQRRHFVYWWATRCCGGSREIFLQILARNPKFLRDPFLWDSQNTPDWSLNLLYQ